jgi:hypothetical protein
MAEKKPSDFRAQWDALQQESAALAAEDKARHGLLPNPKVEEQLQRAGALAVSKDAVAHAAWETTARDLADVLLLAELAWDLWDLGAFAQIPAAIGDLGQRETALVFLCRGVFDASIAQGDIGGTQP